MEDKWDPVGTTWTLTNIATVELECVGTRPIDREGSIPTLHHIGLVRTEKASVRLVPIPNVGRVTALLEADFTEAVLVAPATISRVDDVQLAIRIDDCCRSFVDLSDCLFPGFLGLGDDVAPPGCSRRAAHLADVKGLHPITSSSPAGPYHPALAFECEDNAINGRPVSWEVDLRLRRVRAVRRVGTYPHELE